MIRINLLGEQVDHTGVYILQIFSYCLCVFVLISACTVFYVRASQEVNILEKDKSFLESTLAKLKDETKQVAELEQKKQLLKDKLVTIAILKGNKQTPVHILSDVNTAMPQRSWLTGMKEKGSELEVYGIALDNQTVAQFMQNLSDSKYFGDVDLILSTEHVQDEVKLKQFSLLVKLENPLIAGANKPAGDGSNILPLSASAISNAAANPEAIKKSEIKKTNTEKPAKTKSKTKQVAAKG